MSFWLWSVRGFPAPAALRIEARMAYDEPTARFEEPCDMSKVRKKKKSPQARRPRDAARGSRPTARVNPGIAAAARDNVVAIVGQGRVPERALEIPLSGFFLADHLTRRFEAEAELPHPVACQEGCDSCCYNQVELTPPEALLIGHHIAVHFSESEKELLLAHVARIMEIIKAMGPKESAARRREIPCPLLRDKTCSVYPARPLVCRAIHGLDRERCLAELRTGSLAGSQYYAHRHEIAVSVSAGLREGCRAAGLQSETLNLTRALNDFFTQENAVERWINGEEVFGG
jgi:Fe-S-cluster containining protein